MKNLFFTAGVLILLNYTHVLCQQKINTDSLYARAQEYAKAKEFDKAEKICKDLLTVHNDPEVRFYLGLIYSWNKKYDDARRELKTVHESWPTSHEVMVARINNELWSGNPQTALNIADTALAKKPDDEGLLFQRAKALNDLERYKEAEMVLDTLVKMKPEDEKIKSLSESVKIKLLKNSILADYIVDFFDNKDPWHLAYLQYSRFTDFGILMGRMNYAHRYSEDDIQAEADAYLYTGRSSYIYLNAGISGAKLFPDYRLGAEYYQTFPKGFEASLGMRYLRFSSLGVYIYTGSIAKYWNAWWFSIRPFITPHRDELSYTGVFQVRRYFNDPENFVGLQYTYGSSPDEPRNVLNNPERLRLRSNSIKATYNHRFARVWIFAISGIYAREEYLHSQYQNKYTIDLSLERLF